MGQVIKALVVSGRYKGETVRITNISLDDTGKKRAACFLTNGTRANIPVSDLEVIQEVLPPEPTVRHAKTASMPFVSGSASSRTLTHTKNMQKVRIDIKPDLPSQKYTKALCEKCGAEYNQEERRGRPGLLTLCENCASENFP